MSAHVSRKKSASVSRGSTDVWRRSPLTVISTSVSLTGCLPTCGARWRLTITAPTSLRCSADPCRSDELDVSDDSA